jgi:hypothetical protein
MAGKKATPDSLLTGRVARAVAKREFAAEIQKRQRDQSNPNNTLLSPDELGGDYILSRTLFTTEGGTARPITMDDLATFRARVKGLQDTAKNLRFRGGIRAKQVIDRSWASDRDRANKDIHTAVPFAYSAVTEAGGQGAELLVHFRTNASSDSPYTHHNVNVQFLNLGAVVASSAKAGKRAPLLTKGPLRFECSCPRFKYFFRYVATIAGYVAGRREQSFPKIRNPSISGVSCKHGLRVMQVIDRSPSFKQYIERIIQKYRDDIEHTEKAERIAEQRELEARIRKENWDQRKIRTSDEKAAKRAGISVIQLRAQREAKLTAARERKAQLKAAKQKAQPTQAQFVKQLMTMGFTQDQALAAFKAAQAAGK